MCHWVCVSTPNTGQERQPKMSGHALCSLTKDQATTQSGINQNTLELYEKLKIWGAHRNQWIWGQKGPSTETAAQLPLPGHVCAATEQQCPLLPATETCIQQREGALSGEEGGKSHQMLRRSHGTTLSGPHSSLKANQYLTIIPLLFLIHTVLVQPEEGDGSTKSWKTKRTLVFVGNLILHDAITEHNT